METQKSQMIKTVICRKDHVGETICDLKLDYRTIVTSRYVDQQNRIKNPETQLQSPNFLTTLSKTYIGKKKTAIQQIVLGKLSNHTEN